MHDPLDADLYGPTEWPFKTIPVATFASAEGAPWIIRKILPQAELAVIYGEPGCGKTFMALDMAFSIARGMDWARQRVAKGRIVYICAEGAGGFRKRTMAYLLHHKVHAVEGFDVIPDSPNFLDGLDAPLVASSILKGGPASVIVVDTFSRVMAGGNENSGEDVGHAIAQCKLLHKATGAIVILIHHSGKDTTRGARGWSGLKGAADTEIEVMRVGTGRKAKINKQKDGDDEMEWGFSLEVVELGTDDDGEMVTSCVYTPQDSIPLAEHIEKPLGKIEHLVLDVFRFFDAPSVNVEEIIEECKKSIAFDPAKGDRRRESVIRAINTLKGKGLIGLEDNHVTRI